MEYNKIVSVSGLSGLYELVSSRQDGAVVRSLDDNSSKFVSSRIHNFSHLESIEIYTVKDNVNLVDIFTAMKASSEARPDEKADGNTIKAYFEKVYPDMAFDRVYASDMKKMIKWLAVLEKHGIDIKLTRAEEGDAEGEKPAEAVVEKKKTTKAKDNSTKSAATRNAPPKKITAPRKMA